MRTSVSVVNTIESKKVGATFPRRSVSCHCLETGYERVRN